MGIKNDWIAECDFPVIDTGHDNSYSRFAALIDLCDIVVTGDTMVLHLALGIGEKVVALFGPTSRAEVELYGRGIALAGEVPCLCCYLNDCAIDPSCMQKLKSEVVYQSVEKLLHQKI